MDAHKARQEEVGKLARMAHGAVELRGKDFEHRGGRYRPATVFHASDLAQLLDAGQGTLHLFRVHAARCGRAWHVRVPCSDTRPQGDVQDVASNADDQRTVDMWLLAEVGR